MSAVEGFFVDSNVLLYYVDPVEPEKRARAAEWLEALWMAGTGRLSASPDYSPRRRRDRGEE